MKMPQSTEFTGIHEDPAEGPQTDIPFKRFCFKEINTLRDALNLSIVTVKHL